MLDRLITAQIFAMLLVFARVGTVMTLIPGIGDRYVMVRIRLLFAAAVTILVAPVIAPTLPPEPGSPVALILLVAGEIGIGLFIGLITRYTISTLETAGIFIAFQIGISSALVSNPAFQEQTALTSVLLMLLGLVLMFETGLYQLFIRGTVDSYTLFVPGHLPPIDDFTRTIVEMGSRSLRIAMQLSAPFILFGTLLYIALGLMARLVPQVQVFFVALPIQIMLGFVLFMIAIYAMMSFYLGYVSDTLSGLVSS